MRRRQPPDGVEADPNQIAPALRHLLQRAINKAAFPVYLWGEAGRGKTSAMAAVYCGWPEHAIWLRLATFVSQIQECRRSGQIVVPGGCNQIGESTLWRSRVESPSLLCVDDVGLTSPTESQFGIIYELVDRRGQRPVIYTSNLSPSRLQQTYDGRIFSRMLRGVAVEVTGTDRRMADAVSLRS